MEDELFGNVTWNKDTRWSGIMTLATGKTAAFEIDGDEPVESITEAARNTLKFLIANEPLIRHKIAVSMRQVYNDTWLYENTLTPEELAQRISLHSVIIWDEGGGDLVYTADGNLFAGHWIQVLMDASGEIGEPELEG
ncbi:MAG: DUF2262 domain-containing protein [Pyrinomonadaceae bacterium]